MQYVSAYFDSISNVLVSSSDIVWQLMEEERGNVAADIKFYFLLAMVMRAKQSTNWFKGHDKGKMQNMNS